MKRQTDEHPNQAASPAKGRLQVIYITGVGRSGSTLLAEVLNTFEGFVSVGEFHNLWRRGWVENWPTSSGDPFHSSAFWRDVLDQFSSTTGIVDFDEQERLTAEVKKQRHTLAIRHGTDAGALGTAYRKNFSDLYRAVAEVSKCRVIIDSGKMAYHGSLMKFAPDLEFKLLHLVRHPCAVAMSQSKVKRYMINGDERHMQKLSSARSALRWTYHNLVLARLGLSGAPYARMSYEAFCADPSTEIRAALGKLQVPVQETDIGKLKSGRFTPKPGVAFSGNPDSLGADETLIRPDDRWKTELSPWRKMAVQILSGPVRWYLGV